MAQEKIFNAFEYFETLGKTNRLAAKEGFTVGFCSGIEGVEDLMTGMRKTVSRILIDDTTTQNTYSNGNGFFRKDVYTIFIVAAYRTGDMQDREKKLNICRRIYAQFHSRMIHDKYRRAYGDSLMYLNVENAYSNEFPRFLMDGVCGLYFMVDNNQPIDLTYAEEEWTE